MSARVFLWVQHLLGFGHFARASAIARALTDGGFSVTLASGGVTPADAVPRGVRFVQLPPARAKDEMFDELVDAAGQDVDAAWHQARRDLLLDAFHAARPDVVVTETYPFGRRLLQFELTALIAAAKAASPRPKIVASVRDVLQRPRKDARATAMVAHAREAYDAVLVHGDPAVLRLEASFAEIAAIADMCRYTGYISNEVPRQAEERREILVSAGGGAAGRRLIETAIAARALSRVGDAPWVFVTGPLGEHLPAVPGATVARSLPNFRARLASAAVSISQAGYNTMVETVQAGTPAVVVPFETEREQEQVTRAKAFAARGLVRMLRSPDAVALARAIDATAGSIPPASGIDFGGQPATVQALRTVIAS
jgi:predicted glycosyltransferase